jgi:hypothetical protein
VIAFGRWTGCGFEPDVISEADFQKAQQIDPAIGKDE